MQNNNIWFIESPFPKASAFYHPTPLRPEHDDSHWIKPIYFSPQPIPPIFRASHALNPLSPWSKHVNVEQQHHQDHSGHIVIPELNQENDDAIKQQLVFSENENEDEDPITPVRNQQKCKEEVEQGELHTTGRKSEFEAISKKSRPRQKGLRRLSQRAFEIVQEMRNATYKEVAAKLVQELNDQQFESQNKEEQNIKRRVYDALNVLIALGVLKKDGRRIVSERGSKKGRKSEHLEPEETQALKTKLLARTNIVEEKKRKLRQAQDKFKSITTLLRRNKQGQYSKQTVIPFPFIGIFIKGSESTKLKHEKSDEFLIKSSQPLQPFGDIDSLKWLRDSLQKVSLHQQVSRQLSIGQQQDQSS